MTNPNQNIVQLTLDAALKAGAECADVGMINGTGLEVDVRLGKIQSTTQAQDYHIGLRVFVGQHHATISTSHIDPHSIHELCQRAVAMAKAAPPDPYARLARSDEQAKILPLLNLFDTTQWEAQKLTDLALACEEAALAMPGITNAQGASAATGKSEVTIGTTTGFHASYQRSQFSMSAVVLAEKDGQMERDYDYSACVFAEDLKTPEEIGTKAGMRTLQRLGARKPQTGRFPVIYDRRVSSSLLGHLSSAINGGAIARGTSFLKDQMEQEIAGKGITIHDDPLLKRGLGSRLFDGETLPVQKRCLVENGVLKGWLLDLATAAQLGLPPTGNAVRSLSSPPAPSVSNFIMEPGHVRVEDAIADIKNGFYVTELMGSAVSLTNGDYSRGASGFWIEDGALAWPATGATIAGNLKSMFLGMTPCDDLDLSQPIAAPSLLIDAIMVAGS